VKRSTFPKDKTLIRVNVPLGEWEKIPLLTAKTAVYSNATQRVQGFQDSRIRVKKIIGNSFLALSIDGKAKN
jgi:hypothetical protein